MAWRQAVALVGLLITATSGPAKEADFGFRAGYQRVASAEDGSFLTGAFFRRAWTRAAFLEGAVYYHTDRFRLNGIRVDVESIPVQVSGEVYPLLRNRAWAPYLLAGVGLYIHRTSEQGAGKSEAKYDFGWHLGGGLDYGLWENVFLSADLRYIWLDTEIEGRTFQDTLRDFDSWVATAGLGFRL